jgi:hypothetical protein
LTTAEELKLIIAKKRWAMEELVYSQLMIECNQVQADGAKAMFDWLRENVYSGGMVVLEGARGLLEGQKKPVIVNSGNPKRDLQTIAYHYSWTFEELMLNAQDDRARALFETAQGMYLYLKESYGSGQAVLEELKFLLRHQHGRRKTLILVGEE